VTAIAVSRLRVEIARNGSEIVDDVSFALEQGEIVGLVGESGSGKTTVALALLGHAKAGTRIAHGSIRIGGVEVLSLTGPALRGARGKLVSYVPQDPAAALNPALRIGVQLAEVMQAHGEGDRARERIAEALDEVRLPSGKELLRRYPQQLSGGQMQRVCLAMAFLLRPSLIVLDEPTTGLDVTTQAHVLEVVRELCRAHDAAAVYVSHDLAAVASLAQRVLVMYAGRIVEEGPSTALFDAPAHPYTRKLIGAIPDIATRRLLEAIPGRVPAPGARPAGCVFAARCEHAEPRCTEIAPVPVEVGASHRARCLRLGEIARTPVGVAAERVAPAPASALLEVRGLNAFHGSRQVLHDVSIELHPRECLALVGESGSGKTTLARSIVGLHPPRSGEIVLAGALLPGLARARSSELCRTIQYVFQSATSSLNPRRTVGEIVRTPLEHFFELRGREADARAHELLERVALSPLLAGRYPGELSGGERQRVSIARALAARPELLICDEITSALDTSVQAAIIRLLEDLRETEQIAMLFVTHNLALVRTIADRVVVMSQGRIVERGETDAVLSHPTDPYTVELIADTPVLLSSPLT
jgi:peptide/nickel transport system ATP-binding protein